MENKAHSKRIAEIVINLCNKYLETHPDNYDSFISRGLAYSFISDSREVDDYNNALTLHPEYIDAYKYLGIYSHNDENYKEAIRLYSRAIELEPELAELYRYRAYAYEAIRNNSKAKDDYKKYNELSMKR